MIELNVTEDAANRVVDQMKDEKKGMVNTLNSFRSNDLTHTDAYARLEAELEDLEAGIEYIEEQIEEQTQEEQDEGLGELFG